MQTKKVVLPLFAVGFGALLALSPHLGCSTPAPKALARAVTERTQLVGGQRALGDLGDIALSNGRIRAVIQGKSSSRGFGVFGGSLIDLDLERPREVRDSLPVGGDGLSEIFPAFFLRGLEPDTVEIANDGADGNPAIVRVSGKGSEFITQVGTINDLFLGPNFRFTTEYILEPVAADAPREAGRSLIVRCTATNAGKDPISMATDQFPIAFGFVVLMGGGQDLFIPGEAGFDLRFALERSYKTPVALPGLPGLVARALVSSGEKVSYAIAPERPKDRLNNFVKHNTDAYSVANPNITLTDDSLVVPFVASSFTGMYFHQPPKELAAGESTTFSARIYVGTGDVASALDLASVARRDKLGHFDATVREEGTGVLVPGAQVTLLNSKTKLAVTSCRSLEDGRASATVPPGKYTAAVTLPNRPTIVSAAFEVGEGQAVHQELAAGRSAHVSFQVVNQDGRPIPSKISVMGHYDGKDAGKLPRDFLYDLKVGEAVRFTDLITDDPKDPSTLQYLERVFLVDASGHAEGEVKPGKYTLVASRGIEFDLDTKEVELKAGTAQHFAFTLKQVVDTPDQIAGDFHVHTINSIDSEVPLEERALTYAAEGIEYLAVTDHNYVSDMGPALERAGLSDFVKSGVGLELTTLELGHFNTYPLEYARGAVTHGSFEWFRIPAGGLFEKMRSMSAIGKDRSVVQVNHPRDSILGYFNAHDLDENGNPTKRTDTIRPSGPEFEFGTFSEDFDAIEIMNGKRLELIKTYRVPDPLPPPPLPSKVAATGEIVRDSKGKVAFPGAFEDWFALLKRGKVTTGMANSDSHHVIDGEAGYPRSMVRVGKVPETMRALDHGAIADGIRNQQVLMTNGPLVDFKVNGTDIGGLVSAPGGALTLEVRVRAAPWIDVSRVTLIGSDGSSENLKIFPKGSVTRCEQQLTKTASKDVFYVVEVEGSKGMFPVQTPHEIPPLLINDAVKSIGSAFGIGDDGFGNLRPSLIHEVKPYALTNPIWIDVDGDGVSFGKGRAAKALVAPVKSAPLPRLPLDVLHLIRGFDH